MTKTKEIGRRWQIERCHHESIMSNKNGRIKICTFAGSFGEPDGIVVMYLDKPDGYTVTDGMRCFTPEEAILLGEEFILRGKKARAMRKRWERQHIEAMVPLNEEILDNEDKGAEELPSDVKL
jgi:hypothetical protein